MEENTQLVKKGFFKKVWYSIFKLEKYGEMSAEGFGRAIKYLIQMVIIAAIIISAGSIYVINSKIDKGKEFLNEQVGEFHYKDGILKLENNSPVIAPSSTFGKIIIDTNIESESDINKYLNSIEENIAIIILKDKLLLKSDTDVISYSYESILGQMGIEEMNKDQFIEFLTGDNMKSVFLEIFIILFIVTFVATIFSTMFTALMLSFFGWLATFGTKIRIRYVAIYNLAIYALTLSLLLQDAYMIINMLTGFTIRYFQIMYMAVAAIYLIASIFMIKTEFIKKQIKENAEAELMKKQYEEHQEENAEKEKKNEEEKTKENEENKDTKDEDSDKKEEKNNKEPDGSEA